MKENNWFVRHFLKKTYFWSLGLGEGIKYFQVRMLKSKWSHKSLVLKSKSSCESESKSCDSSPHLWLIMTWEELDLDGTFPVDPPEALCFNYTEYYPSLIEFVSKWWEKKSACRPSFWQFRSMSAIKQAILAETTPLQQQQVEPKEPNPCLSQPCSRHAEKRKQVKLVQQEETRQVIWVAEGCGGQTTTQWLVLLRWPLWGHPASRGVGVAHSPCPYKCIICNRILYIQTHCDLVFFFENQILLYLHINKCWLKWPVIMIGMRPSWFSVFCLLQIFLLR